MKTHPIVHVSVGAAITSLIACGVLVFTASAPVKTVAAAPIEATVDAAPAIEIIDETPIDVPEKITKLGEPISNALARVTKKTFNMEIPPETSPVPNDRFNGFHMGVDFETTPEEKDIDVPIYAICDGKLIEKKWAHGYGGFALQSCEIDGEPVTVVYGHMRLASISPEIGTELKRGQEIGVLGTGGSQETDGVRKHLHLGIHKGKNIDIRGYILDDKESSAWMDILPMIQ